MNKLSINNILTQSNHTETTLLPEKAPSSRERVMTVLSVALTLLSVLAGSIAAALTGSLLFIAIPISVLLITSLILAVKVCVERKQAARQPYGFVNVESDFIQEVAKNPDLHQLIHVDQEILD